MHPHENKSGALRNVLHFLLTHPLTRDRRTAALARFVRWQIESRLRGEVIIPWIGGTRFCAHRGMLGATGNIYAGLHEFADMGFLLHFLRPNDLFIDIGANIGSYTILASGVCGAKTISFEPAPETMAFLRRNVELNKLHQLVVLEQVAMGGEEREVEFTSGLDTVNHVSSGHNNQTQRVRLRTLDSVLGAAAQPSMIKVDVEGYEKEVFRGAAATLEKKSLKAILTEGRQPGDVAPLIKAGFTHYDYDPFTRSLTRATGEKGGNALFLRDEAFVVEKVTTSPSFRIFGRSI